jgi:hypothetical protein
MNATDILKVIGGAQNEEVSQRNAVEIITKKVREDFDVLIEALSDPRESERLIGILIEDPIYFDNPDNPLSGDEALRSPDIDSYAKVVLMKIIEDIPLNLNSKETYLLKKLRKSDRRQSDFHGPAIPA